jgi:integrase
MRLAAPSRRIPPWDLALVLRALREPPFEPLCSCDTKYLTLKTVFLVAFATAARRSELHALSKDFVRDKRWTYVRLKTVDGFLAKNHTPSMGAAAFRSFTIKSIGEFTDSPGLEDEKLFCPVRALKCYTVRTLRTTDSQRLFVSFKKGHMRDIHPNTISSWLKQCIALGYELSGKTKPLGIKGHSVRAMSASWASLKNVSTGQIMDACFWKNSNTFISFYLKGLDRSRRGDA